MTELSALLQNEYKDISFNMEAAQVISVYKRRKAKAYSFAALTAVCVIAALSVINFNTGVITELLQTTGNLLAGYFVDDNTRGIEYNTSSPDTQPPSSQSENSVVKPAETKESTSVQNTTEGLETEGPDDPAATYEAEAQNVPENIGSVSESSTKPEITASGFEYEYISDDNIAITGYTGDETKLVIPETIDGAEVKKIGERAFEKFTGASVIIPDSVITIDAEAFRNASALKKVKLSKNIRTIDNSAFIGCKALEEINLHKAAYIGEYAFKGCASLTELEIPSFAKVIGYKAFADCAELKKLTLNAEYTKDEKNTFGCSGRTFSGCKSLETLTVGSGVRTIQTECFAKCVSLKSIELPPSLRKIATSAFSECESIERLKLPAGLTSIGKLAFYKCAALSEVEFPNTLQSIGEQAFMHCRLLKRVSLSAETVTLKDMCLGYYELTHRGLVYYRKVSGFTVESFENTVAKNYAKQNGFKFESLGEQAEPTTLNLEKYIVTLKAGEKYKIVYTVENPRGETTFVSSDTEVAEVSANGNITAVGAGEAEIRVTNNGVSRKLVVIVG